MVSGAFRFSNHIVELSLVFIPARVPRIT
jgi:hypothetical protein